MTDRMAELNALCADDREMAPWRRKSTMVRIPHEQASALLETVAATVGSTSERLYSHDRHCHLVLARTAYALIMRDRGYSLPAIAESMCRCHTTVLHLLRDPMPAARYVADGVLREQRREKRERRAA